MCPSLEGTESVVEGYLVFFVLRMSVVSWRGLGERERRESWTMKQMQFFIIAFSCVDFSRQQLATKQWRLPSYARGCWALYTRHAVRHDVILLASSVERRPFRAAWFVTPLQEASTKSFVSPSVERELLQKAKKSLLMRFEFDQCSRLRM